LVVDHFAFLRFGAKEGRDYAATVKVFFTVCERQTQPFFVGTLSALSAFAISL
jgi:hypothetical protein